MKAFALWLASACITTAEIVNLGNGVTINEKGSLLIGVDDSEIHGAAETYGHPGIQIANGSALWLLSANGWDGAKLWLDGVGKLHVDGNHISIAFNCLQLGVAAQIPQDSTMFVRYQRCGWEDPAAGIYQVASVTTAFSTSAKFNANAYNEPCFRGEPVPGTTEDADLVVYNPAVMPWQPGAPFWGIWRARFTKSGMKVNGDVQATGHIYSPTLTQIFDELDELRGEIAGLKAEATALRKIVRETPPVQIVVKSTQARLLIGRISIDEP